MRSWKKHYVDKIDRLNLDFLTFHLVPYKGATRRVIEELEYLVRDTKKFALCEEIGGTCSTEHILFKAALIP